MNPASTYDAIGRMAELIADDKEVINRRMAVVASPSNVDWTNRTCDVIIGDSGIVLPDVQFNDAFHPEAGEACWIDFDGPNAEIVMGHDGGAFTDYAPTVTQSGSVSHANTYAASYRTGKLATVSTVLSITGAGTGGNAVIVSVPFDPAAPDNTSLGTGYIYNGTISILVAVVARPTSTVAFQPDNTGALYSTALANGHAITFTITYEVS